MRYLTIILLLILSSFSYINYSPSERNLIETINTLEDMREWMKQDIENNDIDTMLGYSYIFNIEDCINKLSKTKRYEYTKQY